MLHGIVYAGLEDGIYVDGQLKRGKVTYSDGHLLNGRKMLEGVFVDRWLHGPGTCTWCGRRVEKGTFDHGRFRKGTVTNYDSGGNTYTGEMSGELGGDLKRHGNDKMTYENGDVLEGYFYNNWYHGPGKFIRDGKVVDNGKWLLCPGSVLINGTPRIIGPDSDEFLFPGIDPLK